MNSVESLIQTELDRLSEQHQLQIILAIESGSRAWGFPSRDSDYDVRIIYRHKPEWYLSVFEQKDSLNEPINGDLDIAGWDLRKTLSLLHKGNAVVHEWLNSPIVYRSDPEWLKPLSAFATSAFNPLAAFSHYFYMSRNKLESLGSVPISGKAFLYGLRTLLCARWIQVFNEAPPMAFGVLVNEFVCDAALRRELAVMLDAKREGVESEMTCVSDDLIAFARYGLLELECAKGGMVESVLSPDEYDRIFRMMIGC
jgi:uncharacterized protein